MYVDIGSLEPSSSSLENVIPVPTAKAPGRARQLIHLGDSVFSTVRPYMKKVAFIPKEFDGEIASTGFCVLRPIPEKLNPKYLFYFLLSDDLLDQVLPLQRGVSYPAIRDNDLKNASIPVPPIDEQHKIVELLEEHLSRVDVGFSDMNQAKIKAAQFRRSLFRAAFSGNLMGDESRHTTDWKIEKLSALLEVSIGGIWGEEAGTSEVNVSVVRVTELKAHGRIDPSTAVTRSVTQKQLSSRELQEGDLLLEKSGGGPNSPVGRVGYFFQEGTRTVCSNFMQLMRPDPTKVIPKFLFYFLDSFHSNGGTIPMQTATTNIRNIKTPQYMDIEIPLPSIDEQQVILELIEEHLSRLNASTALADVMEKQSIGLRRSLLQAAFTGQLTEEVVSV
jgi:type I restriction enzyme S subunit